MQSAYGSAFADFLCFYYKETALGFSRLFGFSQCRIPRHTCRFYCCLAAHQRTRKKDSAEPSFAMEPRLRGSLDSTSSTRGYPLRRGISAAAVDRDIGSCIQVQTAYPHFDISFGCCVFGLKLFAFQKITPGICLSFFIGGGCTVRSCGYGRFCYGLSFGFPLTATLYQFRWVQAPFTNCAGCKSVVKMRSCG